MFARFGRGHRRCLLSRHRPERQIWRSENDCLPTPAFRSTPLFFYTESPQVCKFHALPLKVFEGSSVRLSGFLRKCRSAALDFLGNLWNQLERRMGRRRLSIRTWIFLLTLLQYVCSEQEDVTCLKGIKDLIQDPENKLAHWTKNKLKTPCNDTFSELEGVTCNNGRVYKLSFAGLGLSGSISPFVSNCSNLQTLDLSANRLTDQIPVELQYMENLAVLNLSVNQLTGTIPQPLALCLYLNVIDLHQNKLTGTIPPELGLLTRLSVFDVSYNRLQGMIPTTLVNRSGMLPHFNASSFIGNKDLYGYPLPPPKNHGLSILAIVGIGLGSGFLSLIVSFTAVCIWLRITEQGYAAEEGKISQLMPEY